MNTSVHYFSFQLYTYLLLAHILFSRYAALLPVMLHWKHIYLSTKSSCALEIQFKCRYTSRAGGRQSFEASLTASTAVERTKRSIDLRYPLTLPAVEQLTGIYGFATHVRFFLRLLLLYWGQIRIRFILSVLSIFVLSTFNISMVGPRAKHFLLCHDASGIPNDEARSLSSSLF